MPWVVAPFTAGGQPRGSFADHLPGRAQSTTRDNALAEATIGLYETECTRDGSPFRRRPLATALAMSFSDTFWQTQMIMEPDINANVSHWQYLT